MPPCPSRGSGGTTKYMKIEIDDNTHALLKVESVVVGKDLKEIVKEALEKRAERIAEKYPSVAESVEK